MDSVVLHISLGLKTYLLARFSTLLLTNPMQKFQHQLLHTLAEPLTFKLAQFLFSFQELRLQHLLSSTGTHNSLCKLDHSVSSFGQGALQATF